MSLEKGKKFIPADVIALPPLKMTLVHAKDERANKKAALKAAFGNMNHDDKIEDVDSEVLKKLIEHLEEEKQSK